jgi:hypothetical protein
MVRIQELSDLRNYFWRSSEDSTLDSQQGFAYASTTKPEPLQVENYKMSVVCVILP